MCRQISSQHTTYKRFALNLLRRPTPFTFRTTDRPPINMPHASTMLDGMHFILYLVYLSLSVVSRHSELDKIEFAFMGYSCLVWCTMGTTYCGNTRHPNEQRILKNSICAQIWSRNASKLERHDVMYLTVHFALLWCVHCTRTLFMDKCV